MDALRVHPLRTLSQIVETVSVTELIEMKLVSSGAITSIVKLFCYNVVNRTDPSEAREER